jgi:hypothetical protein
MIDPTEHSVSYILDWIRESRKPDVHPKAEDRTTKGGYPMTLQGYGQWTDDVSFLLDYVATKDSGRYSDFSKRYKGIDPVGFNALKGRMGHPKLTDMDKAFEDWFRTGVDNMLYGGIDQDGNWRADLTELFDWMGFEAHPETGHPYLAEELFEKIIGGSTGDPGQRGELPVEDVVPTTTPPPTTTPGVPPHQPPTLRPPWDSPFPSAPPAGPPTSPPFREPDRRGDWTWPLPPKGQETRPHTGYGPFWPRVPADWPYGPSRDERREAYEESGAGANDSTLNVGPDDWGHPPGTPGGGVSPGDDISTGALQVGLPEEGPIPAIVGALQGGVEQAVGSIEDFWDVVVRQEWPNTGLRPLDDFMNDVTSGSEVRQG